jgi:hypothetical protein
LSSRRRPTAVTWLSFGLLALGAIYLIRMVGGLAAPALALTVPNWYPIVTGAVWGIAWCISAAATFFGRGWAPRLVAGVGVVFLAWYWFDRLVFVRSVYALRTMSFSLGLTALGVILTVIVLRQPAVRAFFGRPGNG